MKPARTRLAAGLLAIGLAWGAPVTRAQTATTPLTAPAPTASPPPATATTPTNKLVGSFTDLAGSPENAASLVNGLRTGSAITLVDPYVAPGTPPGTPVPATTFSPGTKPMGYGNVRIALSLARADLANQGITNPTPAQLQGALVGTTSPNGTTTQGILQMRASGMGWGQIANSMGFKLGAVMSGKQTYPVAGTTTTASGHSRGVVTGDGSSAGRGAGRGVVTAAGGASGGGNAYGKSKITTAAGSTGSGASHGKSGITTAAGGVGGGNAHVTSAFGQGGSHAASGAVNAAGGKAGSNAGGGQGKGKP